MSQPFEVGDIVFHAGLGRGRVLDAEIKDGRQSCRIAFNGRTSFIYSDFLAKDPRDAKEQINVGRSFAKQQAHRPVNPLVPFNATAFSNEPMPERRFLDARNLIPWEGVTLLFGDGATGKSLLLLQLLCGVARTSKWMGRRVDTGRAVYFSAEDTKAETHIRLGAIARNDGFRFDHLPDLDIHFMAGKDCVLGNVDRRTGIVQATELFQRFRADCLRRKPTLIGIDNLIDVFAGNIIDPVQAKQFMHLLTALSIDCDCPVVLLAHPSKTGMSAGDGDGGTRAWSNSSRARLYLQRVLTAEHGGAVAEDDPDLRVLSTKKANYGPGGTEIRMKWEDGRFIVLDEPAESQPEASGQAMKAERIFLSLLRWHQDRDKFVSPNKSVSYAPTVFARHPKAEGVKARQFENAMSVLLDQRRVEIFTHGSPANRRQHIGLPISREEDTE